MARRSARMVAKVQTGHPRGGPSSGTHRARACFLFDTGRSASASVAEAMVHSSSADSPGVCTISRSRLPHDRLSRSPRSDSRSCRAADAVGTDPSGHGVAARVFGAQEMAARTVAFSGRPRERRRRVGRASRPSVSAWPRRPSRRTTGAVYCGTDDEARPTVFASERVQVRDLHRCLLHACGTRADRGKIREQVIDSSLPMTWTFGVVGRGVDPRTFRFSGGRSAD